MEIYLLRQRQGRLHSAPSGSLASLGASALAKPGTHALALCALYLIFLLAWAAHIGLLGRGQSLLGQDGGGRGLWGGRQQQPIVIVDSPSTLCTEGNETISEHELSAFDQATAFSACPLLDPSPVYSAAGVDLGCLLHKGLRLYCCAPGTSRALVRGQFVMPAWNCYTAPRWKEDARIQWEDTNAYYWKDADTRREEEIAKRRRTLETALAAYTRVTRGKGVVGRRALLDVGSNLGYMLRAAEQLGFGAAVGLENNAALTAASRAAFPQHPVLRDPAAVRQLRVRFDMVIASHVVEHLARPFEFLAELYELMAPGGVLVGEVPDFCPRKRVVSGRVSELEGCLQPWLKAGSTSSLLNLLHLQMWSFDSMRYLLQATGFEVLLMEPSTGVGPEGKEIYLLDFLAVKPAIPVSRDSY